MNVDSLVKYIFRLFGMEVRRNGINSRDDLRLVHFLRINGVKSIIDIGANRGQFAESTFKAGFTGTILSVEPLLDPHKKLTNKAAARPTQWFVHERLALSDTPGVQEMHVTAANPSSSFLAPSSAYQELAPQVRVTGKEEVKVSTLDAEYLNMAGLDEKFLVKIDVQGYESKVICGGRATLKVANGILVELSTDRIYDAQPLALEVLEQLEDLGFQIWDMYPVYRHPTTKRLAQFDVLVFRASR